MRPHLKKPKKVIRRTKTNQTENKSQILSIKIKGCYFLAFILGMFVCAWVYVWAPCVQEAREDSGSPEAGVKGRALWASLWMLGTEPWFCAQEPSASPAKQPLKLESLQNKNQGGWGDSGDLSLVPEIHLKVEGDSTPQNCPATTRGWALPSPN